MKKIICFLLIMFSPLIVFGKEYKIDELKLKINFNDDWIVLTTENIKGNSALAELNITEEYMENLFKTGNIYIDATPKDLSVEAFLRIPKVSLDINNFINYPDEMLHEVAKELEKQYDTNSYEIYRGKYAFVVLNYNDGDYKIINYYTVVNGKGFNFQIQKKGSLTKEEEDSFRKVIDSVDIEIEDSKKEENTDMQRKIDQYNNSGFNWKRIVIYAFIGAFLGGLSSVLTVVHKKKKGQEDGRVS